MNVSKFLFCTVCTISSHIAFSQDNPTSITDEELKKYAVAMDSIDDMKTELLKSISEFVKSNDKITGARYNELSKIINDEQKLTEAKATAEEIAAVKEVLAKKDEGTAKIQETFKALATDFVGASVYNKVRKSLGSDPAVKTRYEAILAEVNKNDGE
jgi:predicted  nucleic acid-binding Zn-ribbon protein